MHSCLYEGRVHHLRSEPTEHSFRYRIAMAYLDLAETTSLVESQRVLSAGRFAPASFLAKDHESSFAEHDQPFTNRSLDSAVRDFAAGISGKRPTGPIRLLTQLRYFGHFFSPLNLFYCFTPEGTDVECVVAEVSNTPWNERHLYLLDSSNRLAGEHGLRFRHPKSFHVSPFMGMNATYDWQLSSPGEELSVGISSSREGDRFFHASMSMRRIELSRSGVRRLCIRYPLMNLRIMAAIYWQALLLWKKKCPFFPHPQTSTNPTTDQVA